MASDAESRSLHGLLAETDGDGSDAGGDEFGDLDSDELFGSGPPPLPSAATQPGHGGSDSDETAMLRRQLEAARTEVRVVVQQLSELDSVRAYALERGREVLALKAQLINLESEADLAREIAGENKQRADSLAEQLRQATGESTGFGLDEPDAEKTALQEELSAALVESDALRQRVAAVELQLADAASDDETALLVARVQELEAAAEQRTSSADAAAAPATAAPQDEEHAARLAQALEDREEAQQRADRLKVALERLRQAFVRVSDKSQRVEELEEQLQDLGEALDVERARAAAVQTDAARVAEVDRELEQAQRHRTDAEARVAELREALEAARGQVGESAPDIGAAVAEVRLEYSARVDEMQARIDELEGDLTAAALDHGGDGDASATIAQLGSANQQMAGEVEALQRQLKTREGQMRKLALRIRSLQDGGATTGGDEALKRQLLKAKQTLETLRAGARRTGEQLQRYLLELEGSKSAVSRARKDIDRYGRAVVGLHEGLNHLERYLHDAGAAGQQALVLMQEVKRCAHEIRAMVESNERFGRAMERVIERLSAVLMD